MRTWIFVSFIPLFGLFASSYAGAASLGPARVLCGIRVASVNLAVAGTSPAEVAREFSELDGVRVRSCNASGKRIVIGISRGGRAEALVFGATGPRSETEILPPTRLQVLGHFEDLKMNYRCETLGRRFGRICDPEVRRYLRRLRESAAETPEAQRSEEQIASLDSADEDSTGEVVTVNSDF